MLSDLIERLLAEVRQARIVARLTDPPDLVAAVDEAGADLAIECAERVEDLRFFDLVTARPQLRALAVVGDGDSAVLYELLPHRTVFGNVSTETLEAAIRVARAPRTVWTSAPETSS